jgi:hypothetical protein
MGGIIETGLGLPNKLMADIFEKARLNPSQLRTVADRRLDDAQYLCDSGKNARANAAMYLAGFVLECLLKAKLLEKFPRLETAGAPDRLPQEERRMWPLCYRSHNLAEILDRLPAVLERLAKFEHKGQNRLRNSLQSLCGRWTIYARYSPRSSDITEARDFVDRVRELKPCLR